LREQIDYGGPTAEQWLALHQAAKNGDNIKRALKDADLPERTAMLWQIITDAEKIAEATERAADGAIERKRDAHETLRFMRSAQPATVADARQIQSEVRKLEADYNLAIFQLEAARIARIHRAGMRQVFPGFFGVTRHIPVRDTIPETVRSELKRLNLSETAVEPWRTVPVTKPLQEVPAMMTRPERLSA
jgi:hypothetical protein